MKFRWESLTSIIYSLPRKKSIVELEVEMLNGQKLQGPETAAEVNYMLKARVSENDCGFDTLYDCLLGVFC